MMRRTRRDMLNKTLSEACLQATTATNEVPLSPMKNRAAALKKARWLSSRKLVKSLSFIVRKKSSSTTTTKKKCCGGTVAVDKTETGSCAGSATASNSNRSTSDESERPVAGIVQTDIERIVANSCSPGPKGDEVILHIRKI